MKKLTVLGSVLTVALLSAPVMAVDFYALTGVQATPTPIQDAELSATEGGAACSASTATSFGGGAAMCSWLAPKTPLGVQPVHSLPVVGGPLPSGFAILMVI